MRFAYLKYRLKKLGCYLLIIILLPYIITVFLSGPGAYGASRVDETMVNVKADGEKSGSDGGKQEDSNAENVDKIQMPLSEYCIGIMAREIPAVYEEEALKTQAVLVRTQVCLALGAGADTILEERYWTKKDMQDSWGADQYSKYYKRLEHAWEETNGHVLTYENALAKTPFCRLSNGSTRDGREALGSEDYPYLKIVDCPLDIESKEQIQTITIDDMDAEVTGVDTAGYVLSVRVGNDTVSGEEFRTNYHLASSCFSFQKYDGKLRITTRGIGHGLGLSQYTANQMAKEGKSMEEILAHFFEGTELKEGVEIVQVEDGAGE